MVGWAGCGSGKDEELPLLSSSASINMPAAAKDTGERPELRRESLVLNKAAAPSVATRAARLASRDRARRDANRRT